MEANQALVDLLEAHRRKEEGDPGADRARLAARAKPWIVPIPGTTKLHRLEENIAAGDFALTKQDLAEVEKAAAAMKVEGERYPPHLMATTGR